MAKLQAIPELRDLATDQQTSAWPPPSPSTAVTASRMGITPQAIDQMLYDAFGQRQVSTLYTQVNQYHIVLETQPEFQKNPSKLRTSTCVLLWLQLHSPLALQVRRLSRRRRLPQFGFLCCAQPFRCPQYGCQLRFCQS